MQNTSKNNNTNSHNKIFTNSSTNNNTEKVIYKEYEETNNSHNRKPSNPNIKKYFVSKNSLQDSNYLKCRKWQYNNDDNHLLIEHEIELISQKIDENKFNKLLNDIKECKIDEISNQHFGQNENEYTIGTLNSLKYLINDTYEFNPIQKSVMNSDEIRLKPYVDKFRKIKKDGNCFFRALIFSFLEYVVLTNNKMLMKELLIIFNDKISENNSKIQKKDYLKENIKKVEIDNINYYY